MTTEDTMRRENRLLPLTAAAITALAFAAWGRDPAIAAFVGGALSVLNWWGLRWLTRRITLGRPGQRAGFSLLLMLKMGALMAAIVVLIDKLVLDPIGLLLGLSTLVVGPVLAATLGMRSEQESNAAPAASEER